MRHFSNHRISRTPRAAGLAGCLFEVRRHLGAGPRASVWLRAFAGSLAPCAIVAWLIAGCGGGNAPRVHVMNASGQRLEGLWIRTETDSTRVPPLDPGKSVDVTLHMRGEALLWVTGTFEGRRIASSGGDYVEGSGGYRFRAVVDSSGRVEVRFLRMGLW